MPAGWNERSNFGRDDERRRRGWGLEVRDLADDLAHAAPRSTRGGWCPSAPTFLALSESRLDGVVRSPPGQEARHGDNHAPPLAVTPQAPPAAPGGGGDRGRVAGPDRLQRRRRRRLRQGGSTRRNVQAEGADGGAGRGDEGLG